MAGQAEPTPNTELDTSPNVHPNDSGGTHRDLVRGHAAKLYGQGWSRSKVARIMLNHLVTNGQDRPEEQRLSQARAKLRRWEQDEKFRDMIYRKAVVDLDLATPEILQGVAKKAKRGRVDAARLALELTGRHNPKGDTAATQVVVAINGVPRPQRSIGQPGVIELEGEVIDEVTD